MTQELLQPRYIVEAQGKQVGELPYPNSPFRVGDILLNYKGNHYIRLSDEQIFTERYPKDFPNIFRKLNWWEYRELDEMPRWLKEKVQTYRAIKWEKLGKDWIMIDQFKHRHIMSICGHEITPITLEEYELLND